jgi:hypothetical protein
VNSTVWCYSLRAALTISPRLSSIVGALFQ